MNRVRRASVILALFLCAHPAGSLLAVEEKGRAEGWGCQWSTHWKALQPPPGAKVTSQPKRIKAPPPAWPADEPHRRGKGLPIIEAVIGPDGKVVDTRLMRRSQWDPPWPEFDQAAVDAVGRWVYTPTKVNGRAVPVCVTITVNIHWK
jgi:TonB family protein